MGNKDGALCQKEVLEALKVVIPVNHEYLQRKIAEMWEVWDSDKSGTIEKREIHRLVEFVRRSLYRKKRSGETISAERRVEDALPAGALPDVRTHSADWFRYWDTDRNGSLDQEECIRAIIHTMEHHGCL